MISDSLTSRDEDDVIRTFDEVVININESHVVSLRVHQGSPVCDSGLRCHKAGRS